MRQRRRRSPFPRLACLALATGAFACEVPPTGLDSSSLSSDSIAASRRAKGLRVMSRNVFLGGDVGLVLAADFGDIVAVTQAAASVWASVQANDFPQRARALAAEIAQAKPHVVGLQEVARFVTLDGTGTPTGALDYLDILLGELATLGLDYAVHVQNNTTVTLPIALGPTGPTELLNFTDRIALLVREDVVVSDLTSANYAAELTIAPGVTLKRGWIRAEFNRGGYAYRFINTHLETQGLEPVQLGQTAELLGPVTGEFEGITLVVGDLNSDAEAAAGAPSWTPTYGLLTSAGFVDLWEVAHPRRRRAGFTCCFAPDLSSTAERLDERIDFVLIRGAPLTGRGRPIGRIKVRVVGDHRKDRIAGLWPADHAGLVARIAPPRRLASW